MEFDQRFGAASALTNVNSEFRIDALRNELSRFAKLLNPTANSGGSRRLTTVFVLTRNKADGSVPEGLKAAKLHEVFDEFKGHLEIARHSIHGSKGLEADYTIIVGLDSGYLGFPSERTSDPLMNLVLPIQNNPLDEERRLFYVGLTRAKRQTILLVAATRPSEYILELAQLTKLQDRIECVNGCQKVRIFGCEL